VEKDAGGRGGAGTGVGRGWLEGAGGGAVGSDVTLERVEPREPRFDWKVRIWPSSPRPKTSSRILHLPG